MLKCLYGWHKIISKFTQVLVLIFDTFTMIHCMFQLLLPSCIQRFPACLLTSVSVRVADHVVVIGVIQMTRVKERVRFVGKEETRSCSKVIDATIRQGHQRIVLSRI